MESNIKEMSIDNLDLIAQGGMVEYEIYLLENAFSSPEDGVLVASGLTFKAKVK